MDTWMRRTVGDTTEYAQGPWVIRKEFYADGPSLFTWVLYCNGNRVDETRTLRAAKKKAAP